LLTVIKKPEYALAKDLGQEIWCGRNDGASTEPPNGQLNNPPIPDLFGLEIRFVDLRDSKDYPDIIPQY